MDQATLPPGIEVPVGMRQYYLPVEDETLEFWGRFLGSEDTDNGESLRWAELCLYRIIDTNPDHDNRLPASDENKNMFGKQMWLLYTTGHSVVYHRSGGACRGGKQVPAGEFGDRAEEPDALTPCPECSPADWEEADPAQLFRLELPWHSYVPCQTVQKVIESLYRKPRCQDCLHGPHRGEQCRRCNCRLYREAPRVLSVPGRNLLETVAKIDPEIAAAMVKVKRL